jgi:hypothetical protein
MTVDQAKQNRDAHWATCRECVPPVLKCAEGRRLHAILVTAINGR